MRHTPANARTIEPVRAFLFSATCIVALVAILTTSAQILHLSFASYTALVLMALCSTPILLYFAPRSTHRPPALCYVLLALIALLFGVLALLALRPDADDFYYLPNAIYAVQHPQEPMGYRVHFMASDAAPFVSYRWATASAYEYGIAAIARLANLHPLNIAYIAAPFCIGILFALSLFSAISQFTTSTAAALLGLVVALLVLLLLGDTHRTPLNLSINRLYQGKTVVISVGIPLLLAESIRFFQRPTRTNWLFLVALSTAALGASTSAIILCIPLMFAAAIVAISSRAPLRSVIAYMTAAAPIVCYALYLIGSPSASPGASSIPNQGWPTSFIDHALFLWNPAYPITPISAAIAWAACVLLLAPRQRAWLLIYTVTLAATFLNPMLDRYVIMYFTQPNTYWRLFYLLPIPLLVGVAFGLLSERAAARSRSLLAVLLISSALVLAVVSSRAPASFYTTRKVFDTQRIETLGIRHALWKLEADELLVAQAITRIAPPGPMLAPSSIAGTLLLLDSRYPQLRIRDDAERFWFDLRGQRATAEQRIAASNFTSGTNEDSGAFAAVLDHEKQLQTIVLASSVYRLASVQATLQAHGFTERGTAAQYTIVAR